MQEQNKHNSDDFLNQLKIREDIRGYHKFVDNAKLNNPDPTSSHFQRPVNRDEKDFAAYDREMRSREKLMKENAIQ